MGFKRQDGTFEDACLAKVKPLEPIFVLRAQDLTAPNAVRRWAIKNVSTLDKDKFHEALDCADAMERWAVLNGGKQPD